MSRLWAYPSDAALSAWGVGSGVGLQSARGSGSAHLGVFVGFAGVGAGEVWAGLLCFKAGELGCGDGTLRLAGRGRPENLRGCGAAPPLINLIRLYAIPSNHIKALTFRVYQNIF
jgi:hypothetical protein